MPENVLPHPAFKAESADSGFTDDGGVSRWTAAM